MYKISHLLGSIISNFLLEYVVFLMKYAIFAYSTVAVLRQACRLSKAPERLAQHHASDAQCNASPKAQRLPKVAMPCKQNIDIYIYIYVYIYRYKYILLVTNRV